jgi:hypothetical protein
MGYLSGDVASGDGGPGHYSRTDRANARPVSTASSRSSVPNWPRKDSAVHGGIPIRPIIWRLSGRAPVGRQVSSDQSICRSAVRSRLAWENG